MNFKTTITLLLFLLLVGAFFFWSQRYAPTTQDQDTTALSRGEGAALFTREEFPTETIGTVTVQRGDQTIKLVKEGTDWREIKPVRFPLNTWSVKDLVDNAAALRYLQRFTPGQKGAPALEQLSLNPPLATATFTPEAGQGREQIIRLGRASVGGRAYVMVNNDPQVYIVANKLHAALLDADFNNWRKHQLNAPTSGNALRVTVTRPGQSLALIKSDSNWSFGPPLSGRVDSPAVDALLSAIGDIYITKFVADNPGDLSAYGLDKPITQIIIEQTTTPGVSTKAPTPATAPAPLVHTLRIGGPTDLTNEKYFATWSIGTPNDAVVFEINKTDLEKFRKTPDDLRDPRITIVKAGDVRELTVQTPAARAYKLLHSPDGWSFADPKPGYNPDNGEVAKLIEALTQAKATAYVPDAKPAEEPIAVLTLTAVGRSEPDVLRVFAPAKTTGSYLVLRNSETTGYQVPAEKIVKTWQPALALRDRIVWKIPATSIKRLEIRQPANQTTYVFERPFPAATQPATQPAASGPWHLLGSPNFETQALDSVLNSLTQLRTEEWLPASAPPPGPAALAVKLALTDGKTVNLTIDPSNRSAVATGIDQPFVAGKDLLDLLSAEFHYRTVLPISSNDIQQVMVTRGHDKLTITKNAAGKFTCAEGRNLTQAAAAGLFDTLAGLRVEHYLSAAPTPHPAASPQTLIVSTRENKNYELRLDGPVGWLGTNCFRLEPATVQKLTAELIEKPKPE